MEFGHFESEHSPHEILDRQHHPRFQHGRAHADDWPGQSRREANHLNWEEHDPIDAIRKKGRLALTLAARIAGYKARSNKRWQRNNRREY